MVATRASAAAWRLAYNLGAPPFAASLPRPLTDAASAVAATPSSFVFIPMPSSTTSAVTRPGHAPATMELMPAPMEWLHSAKDDQPSRLAASMTTTG